MTHKLLRRVALTGVASLFALAAVPVAAQNSSTPGAPSAPSAQPPSSSGSGAPSPSMSSPSTSGAEQRAPAATSDTRTGPSALGGQSVEKLIGKNVVNTEGKKVGDIEDFVVESAGSAGGKEITYAVVGVGGFLGLGEKHVAIPMSELQISADKVQLSSNMSEDQLKQMPSYDKNRYRSIVRNNSGDSGTTTRGDMPGRAGTTTGNPPGSTPPGGGSSR